MGDIYLVGQREQQHRAIGPPGKHYTLVSGCSEDAQRNCCQHVSTGPTKQISLTGVDICEINISYDNAEIPNFL